MIIATIIARTLLGLIFVVFGLNAFFNFIPLPPPKGELAGEFMKALFVSHYLYAEEPRLWWFRLNPSKSNCPYGGVALTKPRS
jgi:uncharacterized membrane protein YphA (DoxX/SURF4 family)